MNPTQLLAVPLMLTLAQIPSCHFYIDAVPHLIISSEPIAVETQPTNAGTHPSTPNPTPPTAPETEAKHQ